MTQNQKPKLDWAQHYGDSKHPGLIWPTGVRNDGETVFLTPFEWRALNHLLDVAANTSLEYWQRKEQILHAFYDTLPKGLPRPKFTTSAEGADGYA